MNVDLEEIKVIKISNNSFDLSEVLNEFLPSDLSEEVSNSLSNNYYKILKAYKGMVTFNSDNTIKSFQKNDEYVTIINEGGIISHTMLLLGYACINVFDIDSFNLCNEKEMNIIKQYHIDNENYEILHLISKL